MQRLGRSELCSRSFQDHASRERALKGHSILIDHLAAHAAIDDELLPGDETGRIGEQPGNLRGDILHRTDTADRMLEDPRVRAAYLGEA